MNKLISLVLSFIMLIQVASCGYLLYPNRRLQSRIGRVDPAIVILDGIGLLLFVIPGLAAFAIDFATNTIYFPAGYHSSLDKNETVAVHVEGELTAEKIESIVSEKSGVKISLNDKDLESYKL